MLILAAFCRHLKNLQKDELCSLFCFSQLSLFLLNGFKTKTEYNSSGGKTSSFSHKTSPRY